MIKIIKEEFKMTARFKTHRRPPMGPALREVIRREQNNKVYAAALETAVSSAEAGDVPDTRMMLRMVKVASGDIVPDVAGQIMETAYLNGIERMLDTARELYSGEGKLGMKRDYARTINKAWTYAKELRCDISDRVSKIDVVKQQYK